MIQVSQIDLQNKSDINRFIDLPLRIYKNHPQWVPPIRSDVEVMLNKQKHPFYEHSDAAFFIANDSKEDIGRIAILDNTRYNEAHGSSIASFYLFDCENNKDCAEILFSEAFDWAKSRGITKIIGPKGFGPLDGYGLLVDGFEHRQMMNMWIYNHPYYQDLIEDLGFTKEVDFISAHIDTNNFKIPDRVHRIAERVIKRGNLVVKNFSSKRELRNWAPNIGQTYNKAFLNNWEFAELTERELKFVIDNIMTIANHRLIKVITTQNSEIVGFLFAFPDVSAAMQRINGRLFPFGIFDLLLEMRRTRVVALNGAGILPEHTGRGGNALLYTEMEKTMHSFDFTDAILVQVAETAEQMRSDLQNLGASNYTNHRVYQRKI